jgi:nucleoside-diphosphate-sugar epimerase
MFAKKIFITGASGCIGHYLVDRLIRETNYELYLLVRNPEKLGFDCRWREGIHILLGGMEEIDRYRDILATTNIAILAATAWGGAAESYNINVNKTLELISYLEPIFCDRIIYFSTASILGRQNQLLPEALSVGTDYIKTKYQCLEKLSSSKLVNKITVVFPTLVFGGERSKPYSHISGGLPEVTKWIRLIRWFRADGSFHFIHAQDIASIVCYLIENTSKVRNDAQVEKLVLGNGAITVDRAIQEVCNYLQLKIYWQISLSSVLINFFIKAFQIQMDDWSWFSLQYRDFIYQDPLTPASFGLDNYCGTLEEILQERGI